MTMGPQHTSHQEDISTRKDGMIAQIVSMGFEMAAALDALGADGVNSVADAVEFLLAASPQQLFHDLEKQDRPFAHQNLVGTSCSSSLCENQAEFSATHTGTAAATTTHGPQVSDPVGNATLELLKKQRAFVPWLSNSHKEKAPLTRNKRDTMPTMHSEVDDSHLASNTSSKRLEEKQRDNEITFESKVVGDLESQAQAAIQKYFGFRRLKDFQLEALNAWATLQDCFVLAATGSGKSLCFQLPAVMTGKVVVVISPLISLMHDQCLQLARRGISACFLGSGQLDKTVENKAMSGAYNIVYICPETILRLVGALQKLAQDRGIALFAIDEAHCVSKWGHDFRPDYRRLSILKEKFKAPAFGLKHDIPIMALTATATQRVREDILNCLHIDKTSAKIVLTTLFRPNLRFSVQHSKTKSFRSYETDFGQLISLYTQTGGGSQQEPHSRVHARSSFDESSQTQKQRDFPKESFLHSYAEASAINTGHTSHDCCKDASSSDSEDDTSLEGSDPDDGRKGDLQLRVEDLEDMDEAECLHGAFNGSWGEFTGVEISEQDHPHPLLQKLHKREIGGGPTIVYMTTRKETERLAKFFVNTGVKAAAYHAKIPKRQLMEVHEQFHNGTLQVVVATVAFGMGIDKPNVRRIIHYGWPQSLEAYYQEAGRAGRDGVLSDCVLYCDMTVLPSLLPSRRDPEQAHNAISMLEHCFRYGLSTSKCRCSTLLNYFGEELMGQKCNICDVCTMGPPPLENLTKEAQLLLSVLVESQGSSSVISNQKQAAGRKRKRKNKLCSEKTLSFRLAVELLNEKIHYRDKLWWRGFGRILQDSGYLREGGNELGRAKGEKIVPSLRFPESTIHGLNFLENCKCVPLNEPSGFQERKEITPPLYLYPEGDMLQASKESTAVSKKSSEWGRGWADPDIRRQRLAERRFKKFKPSRHKGSHRMF